MKQLLLLSTLFLVQNSWSQLSVVGNMHVCEGKELLLFAQGDTSYSWAMENDPTVIISSGSYLSISPTDSTAVLLYSPSDTLRITIYFGGIHCICKCMVPNAFSPDGDLYNDKFYPVINCGEVLGIRMTICNRMDKVVWDKTHYDWPRWDGTSMKTGEAVSQGLYGWQVSFVKENGEVVHLKGHVFLFR